MTKCDDFSYEILHGGGPFAMLKVALPQGKSIKAESGAMVAMDESVVVEGKKEGSLLGGLARKLLTSDSFFFQTLTAVSGDGEVLLSPGILGDVSTIHLDGGKEFQLQKGGFFAASPGVEIATKMQNLGKGLLSGEGFFIQQVSGRGTLFVESFGAIHELDIPAGKTGVVDNHHLVAWEATSNYTIEKAASGWMSSITSGEGLVCKFTGPTKVYIQTRNPYGFANWMSGMIKTK